MLFISCFQVIFMQVISFSPSSSEISRARDVIFISQMKLRSFWQHFEFRKLISHRSLRILWISGPAGQWSPGQQHGPHLGAGCKCRLWGSSQNYLSQNRHFNKPPSDSCTHSSLRILTQYSDSSESINDLILSPPRKRKLQGTYFSKGLFKEKYWAPKNEW